MQISFNVGANFYHCETKYLCAEVPKKYFRRILVIIISLNFHTMSTNIKKETINNVNNSEGRFNFEVQHPMLLMGFCNRAFFSVEN